MRSPVLDNLRGLAVVWMVIFHASYDLRMFGFLSWDFSSGFWYAFPRIIAFTFLFCVGASLNFTHRPQIDWKALFSRSLKLGLCAFIISFTTYFLFPSQWIYFGTLHCILAGSILGALVVNYRKLCFFLLLAILTSQYILGFDISWVSQQLKKPSMDFIPIYPWFWAILLGILVGPHLARLNSKVPSIKPLRFLGQHSLKIYLIHQPLIYGLIWLLRSLV